MSRFKSDEIDEACIEMLGHTNWAYTDTITAEEMAEYKKNNAIFCNVVFFHDPQEEENEDE